MAKKMMKDGLDLNDFLSQMQQIRKLGSFKDILGMIPGMSKMKELKDVDLDGKDIKKIEAIIRSMTMAERTKPSLIDGSRRKRIAAGSGTQVQDVNQLLKRFEETNKMMKQFTGMNKGKKKGGMKFPFM